MNILFIFLTYRRPKISALSLETAFNNTTIKPTETWILDDGSPKEMQNGLVTFANAFPSLNINLSLKKKNVGVGWAFEDAYHLIKSRNPDIAVIIESDYIWRKGWLEDVLAIYKANPFVCAIPGTSHPDMYDKYKTFQEFPELMKNQFGEDVKARSFMYNPFDINTEQGLIKVQGVSNSCGCSIIFWNRFNEMLKEIDKQDDFWFWMDRAFHKWGNTDRTKASDAHLSGTITYYWEQWAKKYDIDLQNNFGWLDICDFSIAQHICGGEDSINGKIVAEGCTFILSPCWKDEYLKQNPRKTLNN